ncbi:hypothetical protein DL767_010539 [Monosporascus sp. MG133]|nr:hypothetical protein DL767_010539 [Monosporascus sp. MG133]
MNEDGYTDFLHYTYEYGLGIARFWSDVYVSIWKGFADDVLKTPEVSNEAGAKGNGGGKKWGREHGSEAALGCGEDVAGQSAA